jgi:transcription elongation factor Elf1
MVKSVGPDRKRRSAARRMEGEKMLDTEQAARMCPICGEDSSVYDTRETPNGKIIRRRRCTKCGAQFETEETFARFLPGKNQKNF